MNIWQPLKLHFFVYRKFYLYYWFIIVIATLTTIYLLKDINYIYDYLNILIITTSFISTLLIGIYEYNKLSSHYINLKTIRLEFYISSIILCFVNAIIQTAIYSLIFITVIKLSSIDTLSFPYSSFTTFLTTFFVHIFIFTLGNLITILFKKIINFRSVIYLVILIASSIYFSKYTNVLINKIENFYNNKETIIKVIPVLFLISCFMLLTIYLIFNKRNRK